MLSCLSLFIAVMIVTGCVLGIYMAEARHSLATALSILRPRLGSSVLETTRDHVTLLGNRLTVDLDRLFAMDILGTEATGHLEVAAPTL